MPDAVNRLRSATSLPRDPASATRAGVMCGTFISTQCTSLGVSIPASAIAARTASAASRTCTVVPYSSGQQAARVGCADHQPFGVAAAGFARSLDKQRVVRAHQPGGATDHHHRDALERLGQRDIEELAEQQLQRLRRIAAHQPIAFGLRDDANDMRGIDLAAFETLSDFGNIGRSRHGHRADIGVMHLGSPRVPQVPGPSMIHQTGAPSCHARTPSTSALPTLAVDGTIHRWPQMHHYLAFARSPASPLTACSPRPAANPRSATPVLK